MAISRSGRRSPAIWRSIGTADVVFLGVKAHSLTALAPQLRPLFAPDTIVVSTQNGIPWWYFQDYGGELDGLRLERVDPGGVDRLAHRAAPRGRIARLLRHGHRRARRHSSHRGQPHQLRRAGRTEVRARQGDRRGADCCRFPLPGHDAFSSRDLGQAARQRRLQSDQRADRRDARRDGASSGGVDAWCASS